MFTAAQEVFLVVPVYVLVQNTILILEHDPSVSVTGFIYHGYHLSLN